MKVLIAIWGEWYMVDMVIPTCASSAFMCHQHSHVRTEHFGTFQFYFTCSSIGIVNLLQVDTSDLWLEHDLILQEQILCPALVVNENAVCSLCDLRYSDTAWQLRVRPKKGGQRCPERYDKTVCGFVGEHGYRVLFFNILCYFSGEIGILMDLRRRQPFFQLEVISKQWSPQSVLF